ncbi:ATP-dependent RNA helicase ddx24-like [Acropora millepora]|uniref:ATP-dependent RNA helicase ddx24-like n=1 Tax=Acropora millepora TaxID=45264 RepID=UPI001CF20FF9|nr:ATP-dependent RNA helicase ddx24-like [Acropora millepora]
MAEKNSKSKKRKWKPVELEDVSLFADDDMEGFVSLEVLEDYNLVEFKSGEVVNGASRMKKAKKLNVSDKKLVDHLQASPLPKSDDKTEEPAKKRQRKKKVKNMEKLDDKNETSTSKETTEDSEAKSQTKSVDVPNKTEKPARTKKRKKKVQRKDNLCVDNEDETSVDHKKFEDSNEWKSAMVAWESLGVPTEIQQSLSEQGFTSPTPIQMLSLPPAIFHCQDIIGAAETGSGKTLAFGIPLLTHILNKKSKQDNELVKDAPTTEEKNESLISDKAKKPFLALIMTPTRELALQVTNHLKQAAKHTSVEIVAVVGGMAPQKQQRLLHKHPEIIVATPGRLWDLISEKEEHVSQLDQLRFLVIDEADRMVEQGHFQELASILDLIHISGDSENEEEKQPKKTLQKFIFSATLTLPKSFRQKGRERTISKGDVLVSLMDKVGLQKNSCKVIDVTNKRGTVETLTETKILCSIEEKDLYLYYFLCRYPGRTLVFSNTVDCVRRLGSLFRLLNFDPWVLHASMQQRQRLKNLDRFKSNARGLLLATDVAARGLDIPSVEHVIHYQVPKDPDLYIHRSGRTARASREGLSVVLVAPQEAGSYKKIMKSLNSGNELNSFPVDVAFMSSIKKRITLAKKVDKEEFKFRRKKSRNDWVLSSAKAMDIEVDEDLLEDLGDVQERKQQQGKLKQMKAFKFVKAPLIPLGFSGKYPTKSGALIIPGMNPEIRCEDDKKGAIEDARRKERKKGET